MPVYSEIYLDIPSNIPRRGVMRAGEGARALNRGKDTIRAGQDFMSSPHSLTRFEIQKFYEIEPKSNQSWQVKMNRNSLNSFVCE